MEHPNQSVKHASDRNFHLFSIRTDHKNVTQLASKCCRLSFLLLLHTHQTVYWEELIPSKRSKGRKVLNTFTIMKHMYRIWTWNSSKILLQWKTECSLVLPTDEGVSRPFLFWFHAKLDGIWHTEKTNRQPLAVGCIYSDGLKKKTRRRVEAMLVESKPALFMK